MPIVRRLFLLLIVGFVQCVGAVAFAQGSGIDAFATNECFAKGGIGIIDHDLYVPVKSASNELIWGADSKRWTGGPAANPEIIIFFQGAIWSPQSLPQDFDLTQALVVSFEPNKVRFFDFAKMSGCYYKRTK